MREARGKSRGPQYVDASFWRSSKDLQYAATPPALRSRSGASGRRLLSPYQGLHLATALATTQPLLEAPPGIRRPGQYLHRSTAPHTTPALRSARPAGDAAPAQYLHHTRLLTTPARPSVNCPAGHHLRPPRPKMCESNRTPPHQHLHASPVLRQPATTRSGPGALDVPVADDSAPPTRYRFPVENVRV